MGWLISLYMTVRFELFCYILLPWENKNKVKQTNYEKESITWSRQFLKRDLSISEASSATTNYPLSYIWFFLASLF